MAAAAAVDASYESFLITHAGITAEFWASVLGGPLTAAEDARRINDLAKTNAEEVFRANRQMPFRSNPNRMALPSEGVRPPRHHAHSMTVTKIAAIRAG